VEKVGLFSENGSWDPLGTLPLVVQNGEELQTYFLGEVVEKAALFSGSGSWDPLGAVDFGQEEHIQGPLLSFRQAEMRQAHLNDHDH
jgi:hypothetical protein